MVWKKLIRPGSTFSHVSHKVCSVGQVKTIYPFKQTSTQKPSSYKGDTLPERMWIKYVILRLATQPDIFMEWPPLLSRSCQPGQFWLSCKIAEFESQCPCYLQQTFPYLSISISFVDFRATCLLCLNWMWLPSIAKHWKPLKSIAKRAPPMFRLVANSSDCLPVTSPLFLNHIWICSQIISGFVPRTSTHLFPIGCGPGSNCEGGFLEQESPYLLLRCFHISPSTWRPSAAAACLLVAAHTWGGLASDC